MQKVEDHNKVMRGAAAFLIIAGIIAILQYFKSFLQPFVVALILWFLVVEVRNLLGKIKISGFALPRPILTIISAVAVFFIFYGIVDLVIVNFQSLAKNAGKYGSSLVTMLENAEDFLGIENLGEAVQGQQKAIVSGASVAAQAVHLYLIAHQHLAHGQG